MPPGNGRFASRIGCIAWVVRWGSQSAERRRFGDIQHIAVFDLGDGFEVADLLRGAFFAYRHRLVVSLDVVAN